MARRRADLESSLTEEQRRELLDGNPYLFGRLDADDPLSAFSSDAEKRAAWEAHVGELTEAYARKRPGRRPHVWWAWSAPEDAASFDWKYGDPRLSAEAQRADPEPPRWQPAAEQARFLAARGLLFSFEEKALKLADS